MIKQLACFAVALALFAGARSSAGAAPTPIPGGANQISAVSGNLSSTIFNGSVRFRKMVLRTSTAAEGTADPGGMALTFTYLVSNGMSKNAYGGVSASLADADGVVVGGKPYGVYGAYYSMPAGAVARGTILFSVPAGFTPVKMLVQPPNGKALRIALKPSDIPKPPATPAPAASATP